MLGAWICLYFQCMVGILLSRALDYVGRVDLFIFLMYGGSLVKQGAGLCWARGSVYISNVWWVSC